MVVIVVIVVVALVVVVMVIFSILLNSFEHRRLPAETYAWLKKWYFDEKQKMEQDEGAIGPCMNQVNVL